LDNDTVLYLYSDEDREPYIIDIDKNGLLWRYHYHINTDNFRDSDLDESRLELGLGSGGAVESSTTPSTTTTLASEYSGACDICQSNVTKELLTTGSDGWIFVIRGATLFAHPKKTKSNPR
jgi:hypothetical protein